MLKNITSGYKKGVSQWIEFLDSWNYEQQIRNDALAKELVKIDINLGKYNSAARERQVANMWKVISSVDANNETMTKFFGELYNGFINMTGNNVFNGQNWHKDSYFFKAGHRHDVINDKGYDGQSYLNERNDLVFKGANLANAKFIHSGADLVIQAYGTNDSVTLPDFFHYQKPSNHAFNFIFEDQSIRYEDLYNYVFTQIGDENDNVIVGWDGKDILNGGAGNDILWGSKG